MYANLSDGFHADLRIRRAGNAGAGAFARSLSWVAANGTGGLLPEFIANEIGSDEVDALVALGLWERVTEGEVKTVTERNHRRPDIPIVISESGLWIPRYLRHNIAPEEYREYRRKQRANAAKRWGKNGEDPSPDPPDSKLGPADDLIPEW